MALNAKQRQKKLERKKKKKAQAVKKSGQRISTPGSRSSSYTRYPVHECLVPENLFEQGLGTLLMSRRAPNGTIAVGFFLLDVFCLGVKNAGFRVCSSDEYEHQFKRSVFSAADGTDYLQIDAAQFRKLVEEAAAYASSLGFEPHSDYREARRLFGAVDASTSDIAFEFGKHGKPIYISGPHDSPTRIRQVMKSLQQHRGEGSVDDLQTRIGD
jgi:hypothetical protein